ncbi:MAG: STAS domain-containing protein [Flavobacteriales bacterium]
MDFSFKVSDTGKVPVIAVKGRLMDKDSATDLSKQLDTLLAGGKNKFIFDLGELEYINSMGLNLMVNYLTKVRNAGGDMSVANVSDKVSQLLVVTKLNTLFAVHPDAATAMEKMHV